MNKQQLQQEIAELQKQLEEKQKALSAMPDKWEPKGGEWFIDLFGEASITSMLAREASGFGLAYATREQAEKAAKAMRAHNRLLAYVAEFSSGFELLEYKSTVWFDSVANSYDFGCEGFQRLGAVYMPLPVAVSLARKLNSGEVEL